MQITQKDIAKRAGVSCATVSRVIRNREMVRSQLAAKVYKAMRELGVEIDGLELSAEKRNSILVVVDNFEYSLYASLIYGISEALNEQKISMVLCSSNMDIEIERQYITIACREGYLGIIFVTAKDDPEYRRMMSEISIPVVMLNRKIDGLNYDSVQLAHFDSAQIAVGRLKKMGHRRIALLTTDVESTNTRDEKAGFINAMVETGLSYHQAESSVFYEPNTYQGGRAFAEKFVEEALDFTAVYFLSSEHCTGFVSRFQQFGKRIPDDLSIIALNKVPILLGSNIVLTTLEQPAQEMGRKAVELVLKRNESPNSDFINIQYSVVLKEGSSINKVYPYLY